MCQVNPVQIPILFESRELAVLAKPTRCHFDEALTRCKALPDPEAWEAVHRLDFETSGCLVVARREFVAPLREMFQREGAVSKRYLAGASSELPPGSGEGVQTGFVVGRHRGSKKVRFVRGGCDTSILERQNHSVQAVKHRLALAPAELAAKAREALGFTGIPYEVELLTGARHQIRAYFASLNCPLVGDPVYGTEGARLELHAWHLTFTSPVGAGEKVDVRWL